MEFFPLLESLTLCGLFIYLIAGQHIRCSAGVKEKEWLSSLGKYASMCFQADVYRTVVDKS